jgi:hypothetical protein
MGGTKPDFDHWRLFDTLRVWEAAAMMHGYDPRAYTSGELPLDEHDDYPDLTLEKRRIISAVLIGGVTACPATTALPDNNTEIDVATLIAWLRAIGYGHVADGLSGSAVQASAAAGRSKIIRTGAGGHSRASAT